MIMKKVICVFLTSMFLSNIYAQIVDDTKWEINATPSYNQDPTASEPSKSHLPKFGEMVKSYDILSTIRGLQSYSDKDGYIPVYDMDSFPKYQFDAIFAQYPSRAKYLTESLQTSIRSFYRNIGFVEDVSVVKSLMCPNFAVNSANDTCVYVGSFSLELSFNSLRTSALERAKSAIDRVIFPIIQKTIDDLTNMGHPYVMIAVGYGVKDFSDKYSSGDGACVMCIFSIKDLKDFAGLELSQEELLHRSSVYVKDTGEIKKVSM